MVEDDLWSQYSGEPASSFHDAVQSFLDDDLTAASESIDRGSAFVRVEGSRADPDHRAAIQGASDALTALANQVRAGQVTDVKDMNPVFARADRVLAEHHLLLADEAEGESDARRVGLHLEAAAQCLRELNTWLGDESDRVAGKILDRSQKLGKQLEQGKATLDADARQALTECRRLLVAARQPR